MARSRQGNGFIGWPACRHAERRLSCYGNSVSSWWASSPSPWCCRPRRRRRASRRGISPWSCPWAAGGGTDTLARTLAKNAKKYFGVNINVVNRVGGTGVVGMNSVATSKPDGYTVGVITFNLSTYRLIGLSELSYRDFDLIALLNRSPAGFSVKTDSQFKTLKDLVEYAKANPGVVTVGHSGPGQPWHLSAARWPRSTT